MQLTYDRSWRLMDDADLRRALTMHRRALATVADDNPDPEVRESTRRYLVALVQDGAAEDARRDRAAKCGVPRDAERFPADWLANLKAHIRLDTLVGHELGARLGKERDGKRRGPCPLCKTSDHSDCFIVHTADDADQWYYCHRCGATGDCFAAIMQAWGLEFPQAVEKLARDGGFPLPAKPKGDARLASLPGKLIV